MKRKRRLIAVVLINVVQSIAVLSAWATYTEAAQAAGRPAWGLPLAGEASVNRPFQPPATAWGAGHRGVDLGGAYGEAVLSAGAGRVSYAGLLAGRGVVVVTHEGGLRTTYEPVEAEVRVGATVEVGTEIGTLSTGHDSCLPGTTCLHWGLLRGQTYLDPLLLITQGHLRLLPLGGGQRAGAVGRALTVSTVGRLTSPSLLPEVLAHPTRKALSTSGNLAFNIAGFTCMGYGLYRGARRIGRLVRRLR